VPGVTTGSGYFPFQWTSRAKIHDEGGTKSLDEAHATTEYDAARLDSFDPTQFSQFFLEFA
jgi:hypothetical protein